MNASDAGGGFKQPATVSCANEPTAKKPSTSTERKPGRKARGHTSLSVAHALVGYPSSSVGSALGRSRAQLVDHNMNHTSDLRRPIVYREEYISNLGDQDPPGLDQPPLGPLNRSTAVAQTPPVQVDQGNNVSANIETSSAYVLEMRDTCLPWSTWSTRVYPDAVCGFSGPGGGWSTLVPTRCDSGVKA